MHIADRLLHPGKWSLEKVDPTAARCDFDYQSITLQRDRSYYAEAREPPVGEVRTTSGTYTFKDGTVEGEHAEGHDGPHA